VPFAMGATACAEAPARASLPAVNCSRASLRWDVAPRRMQARAPRPVPSGGAARPPTARHPWQGWAWRCGVLGTVGLAACSAPAQQYFARHWQVDEGLPQNAVTAIVQTRDGYLWLGTYGGLVRFDGIRFVAFNSGNTPELVNSRITSLFEDAEGRLWIGHETGELSLLQAGRFKSVPVPGLRAGGKVVGMGQDQARDLWLFREDGTLVRGRDGLVLDPEAGTAARVATFACGQDGTIWVARGGRVSAWRRGRLEPVDFDAPGPNPFVQGIAASRRGGVWVAGGGRLRRWDDGRWVEDRAPNLWGDALLQPLVELRDGSLAGATTAAGLYLIDPSGQAQHFSQANLLPQNWVRSLCEDHEGNLWAGVGTGGLVALRPGKVAVLEPPDRWQGRAVLSVVAARDDALWVSTEGAGLYRFQAGQWRHFDQSLGLSNLFVWPLAEDGQGRLWAGTWGGGLFVLQNDRFTRPPGLETLDAPVTALFHTPAGVMWIGTGDGLLRYADGQVIQYGRAQGLELPDVRAVLESPDGTVWFGMSGGGLGCLKGATLKQYQKKDGLPCDYVQCLWLSPDGRLWLGTDGEGLVRFHQEHFAAVSSRQGLPSSVICHVIPDGQGHLWVSSRGGIFRVSLADLEHSADTGAALTTCVTYGRGEGLPTAECSGGLQPAGARARDGRLWFPTTRGLVGLDPHNLRTNCLPPRVVIEEVRVDDQRLDCGSDPAQPLRVSAGRRRFEFRYTGLSFTVPEKVRFRFRLEGLETDWTEAGGERVAVYRYVPPGQYRFRVIACNNDGVWNETGAQVAFCVLPRFWQTAWFQLPAAAAALTAVAAGARWLTHRRLRRRMERLERQQALERERARIAKDIHDDLGASLTRITLLSQSARAELDDDAPAAADLDRIYATVRELTRALDEIVWAVNPRHDTLDSLATYLGRFAQDFLAAAHVRCRLEMPMHLPHCPLTAETRHNLFLAFKEALHNAVKHARAPEVRVCLRTGADQFVLRVEDNGHGFDAGDVAGRTAAPPDRPAAGNGLANMRQRLAEIGGRFELESAPGRGTTVVFVVPLKTASA